MTDVRRLVYVGIGVGKYDDLSFKPLPRAVPGVVEVAEILRDCGSVTWLAPPHPTEQVARDHLIQSLPPGGLDAGTGLIVLWAGHALLSPEPTLHLIGKDTDPAVAPLVKATDIASIAARSGARQILIVLDTCYSGDAALAALTAAANVQAQLAACTEDETFVGVLTATLPLQRARDGVFGERLARILTDGPREPLTQSLWSRRDSHVSLDVIADTLRREWDSDVQQPKYSRDGTARQVFPNPRYDATAPDAIVEHLLLAARGAEPGDETSYFTGRVEPLDRVVGWLAAEQPGVFVVTGPAGSGKSAIVGRVVSLSDPAERERILASGSVEHADPGAQSVQADIHARGLTAARFAEELDRRLVHAGILEPNEDGWRNRGELFGALERVGGLPVIAIDGLDEAGDEAWKIAEDVVRLLRTQARFLIGTRDLAGSSLVDALQPDEQIDLGQVHFARQTTEDVIGYTVKRLTGVAADRMDPDAVGQLLTRSAAASGEGAFLLARIVTAQLRESPIDTTTQGWEQHLATAVDAALEHDLERIDPLTRDDATLPDGGRELLTALAWSYGAGMPQDVWATAASGLSPTGTDYGRDDILWLLENAGRYVVESGEAGRAVYRLAHQRLADLLLPSRRIDHVEDLAARLSHGLVEYYLRLLEGGSRPDEPAYLWRYTWRHAADGGAVGVDALRRLVDVASLHFLPDLASALNSLGVLYSAVGRREEAIPPTEEAVEVCRAQAAENPAYLPDLASALNNLGVRYSAVGRREEAIPPTEEAVELRRAQAAENPAYLSDLASALNNLGARYNEVGRREEAIPPTEEAVELHRAQAAENPAYLPNLASALNNLGVLYSEVGRREEAIPQTEEAVERYRAQAAENPAYLPDLASALNNLGVRYSEVGRREEAIPPTEEAVEVCRAQAAENAAYLPDLAMALNNLGVRYSEVGRREEAIPPTEEAVEVCRAQAAENAAYLPDLAMALNNLGILYSEVGRRQEAIPPAEEAVERYRAQAAENPAYLPNLAMALNNLGNRYSAVGRREEAIPPTEEAVEVCRAQAAENPAYLPSLAGTLNNLGVRYSEVGRREEAIPPTEEAVQLHRAQAAENPAYLPDLAGALNNLGNRYSAVGRREEAIPPTEEAVEVCRAQAAENPAYLPNLAMALNNLGVCYSAVGRREDAIPPTEEALQLRRAQAAENPAYLPDLAGALNNLGIRYSAVGRREEAIPPTEEAVELHRAQAAENPAYLPALASALNNLGVRYSEVGRGDDAIPPTEEAVELRRAQAAENPAYLANLAGALNNLGIFYSKVGRQGEIDAAWKEALGQLPSAEARDVLQRLRNQ